jgi:hypothetical protein
MKLGKDLCGKVTSIPDGYVAIFVELLDHLAEKKLYSMVSCDESELAGKQKAVAALGEVKNALDAAKKEATLYNK